MNPADTKDKMKQPRKALIKEPRLFPIFKNSRLLVVIRNETIIFVIRMLLK